MIPTVHDWEDIDHLAVDPGRWVSPRRVEEFKQLLRFLRFRPLLDLSFDIQMGERPDCVISALNTDKATGIELTLAVCQPWQEAQIYLGSTITPKYSRVARNWLGQTKKKGKDLGQHLEAMQSVHASLFSGAIFSSREAAADKADEVIHAIQKKGELLDSPDFRRYYDNWLVITDKLPFLSRFGELCEIMDKQLHVTPVKHDAVYFVTERGQEDVLCQICSTRCQVVGHLPKR